MDRIKAAKQVLSRLDSLIRPRGDSAVQVVTETDIKTLRRLLAAVHGVHKVRTRGDGDLDFQVADAECTTLNLKVVAPNKLVLVAVFSIPKGKEIAALLATMIWNDNKSSSHNTAAHITLKNLCTLESHLPLDGGVTIPHLEAWIRVFVQAVQPFSDIFSSIVDKYETLASKNRGGLLEALQAFAELGASLIEIIRDGVDGVSD